MNWKIDISCFDHILQCAIHASLQDGTVREILTIARRLVTHFHHSPLQTAALKDETSKYKEISYRKLKQECPTRWGSTYEMLERLIQMKKPVTAVIVDSKKKQVRDLNPSAEFWVNSEALSKPLKTLNQISTEMCGESYCTISSLYAVAMNLLSCVMKPEVEDLPFIRHMKELFCEYLEKRLEDNNLRFAMEVSSVLDPRMKNLPFISDQARNKAYKTCQMELETSMNSSRLARSFTEETVQELQERKESSGGENIPDNKLKLLNTLFGTSSWTCYDEPSPKRAKKQTTSKKAFEQYLQEESVPLVENPLTWWRNNEGKHPEVAKLAKFYLGIPTTSATSERAFSTAGLIVTQRRNSLNPQTVRLLHFLNKNL